MPWECFIVSASQRTVPMWIQYIGLTIIMQKDILYTDLSNICGYLSFLPLSGVSQAQLGNRKRLRYLPSLSLSICIMNIARRRWETCIMFFETFPNLRKRTRGRLGQYRSLLLYPIRFSKYLTSHFDFNILQISYG